MTPTFNDYILIILIILAIYFDLTQKKIPNFLTLPVMLWGLLSYTYLNQFDGLLFSLYGLLLGIGLFIIPFALGGMGGGDVKLLGAIGALKGMEFIFFATIYTAICGGIIAIIYMAFKGQVLIKIKRVLEMLAKPLLSILAIKFKSPYFNNLSSNFSLTEKKQQDEKPLFFPYGVAIGLGTIITLYAYSREILIVTIF